MIWDDDDSLGEKQLKASGLLALFSLGINVGEQLNIPILSPGILFFSLLVWIQGGRNLASEKEISFWELFRRDIRKNLNKVKKIWD